MRKIFFLLPLCSFPYFVIAQVNLQIKMFIEGYYCGNGLMDNFGSGGCLYIAGFSPNQTDADTVDVSLIEPTHFYQAAEQKGILHTNGSLTVSFPSLAPGSSYFIRLKHRNALETWSALPIIMQSTTIYDFTDSASKAYGANMTNVETTSQPRWALYSGDISDANYLGLGLCFQDGVTDGQDYSDMENAVSQILTGYNCQDLTGDNFVETSDYLIEESAVTIIRIALYPSAVNVGEINSPSDNPSFNKCISINGKIYFSFSEENQNNMCELYDSNGKLIWTTNLFELKNYPFADGLYFIRFHLQSR